MAKTAFIKTQTGEDKIISYDNDKDLDTLKNNQDIKGIETGEGRKLKEETENKIIQKGDKAKLLKTYNSLVNKIPEGAIVNILGYKDGEGYIVQYKGNKIWGIDFEDLDKVSSEEKPLKEMARKAFRGIQLTENWEEELKKLKKVSPIFTRVIKYLQEHPGPQTISDVVKALELPGSSHIYNPTLKNKMSGVIELVDMKPEDYEPEYKKQAREKKQREIDNPKDERAEVNWFDLAQKIKKGLGSPEEKALYKKEMERIANERAKNPDKYMDDETYEAWIKFGNKLELLRKSQAAKRKLATSMKQGGFMKNPKEEREHWEKLQKIIARKKQELNDLIEKYPKLKEKYKDLKDLK